jgi:hypothetical protein
MQHAGRGLDDHAFDFSTTEADAYWIAAFGDGPARHTGLTVGVFSESNRTSCNVVVAFQLGPVQEDVPYGRETGCSFPLFQSRKMRSVGTV